MLDLPNLGLSLINKITGLCGFCTGLLGSEIAATYKDGREDAHGGWIARRTSDNCIGHPQSTREC